MDPYANECKTVNDYLERFERLSKNPRTKPSFSLSEAYPVCEPLIDNPDCDDLYMKEGVTSAEVKSWIRDGVPINLSGEPACLDPEEVDLLKVNHAPEAQLTLLDSICKYLENNRIAGPFKLSDLKRIGNDYICPLNGKRIK